MDQHCSIMSCSFHEPMFLHSICYSSISHFPVSSFLLFINGLGKVSTNSLHLPEAEACILNLKRAWNPQEEVNDENL